MGVESGRIEVAEADSEMEEEEADIKLSSLNADCAGAGDSNVLGETREPLTQNFLNSYCQGLHVGDNTGW